MTTLGSKDKKRACGKNWTPWQEFFSVRACAYWFALHLKRIKALLIA